MKIDINISLSDNNIQSSMSASFSNDLDKKSREALQPLIETFVKDVAEVFSKGTPGPGPAKESQVRGWKNEEPKKAIVGFKRPPFDVIYDWE